MVYPEYTVFAIRRLLIDQYFFIREFTGSYHVLVLCVIILQLCFYCCFSFGKASDWNCLNFGSCSPWWMCGLLVAQCSTTLIRSCKQGTAMWPCRATMLKISRFEAEQVGGVWVTDSTSAFSVQLPVFFHWLSWTELDTHS